MTGMFRSALGIAYLFVLSSATGWGQATAEISGTVTDQSGSAVGSVVIKATQTATGAVRTTISAENGDYVLANLPVGPYMIEAALPGFSTYAQTGIVLQVNTKPTIGIVLRIGDVNQTVDVKADAAMVETSSTGLGTVIDNKRVEELPLNGRLPTQLIFLAGMAQPGQASLVTQRNYPTMLSISVAGGTGEGVVYMLDGVNHNDAQNNLSFVMPFPDALQEFKVESSALPAQYGYNANAAVTAITKSGANEFHGDLFEFVRNGNFNARNFFAPARDSLKRNQYGGVVGGPIRKNKLFFFAGYQATVNRSNPPTTPRFVPTAATLAGDFTTVASPLCNGGRQITLSAAQGFVGNRINPALFSPVALNLASLLPTTADPCGRITVGLKGNTDEHIGVSRLDYTQNAKSSFYVRALVANMRKESSYDGVNPTTISSPESNFRNSSLAITHTYLFGPTVVNSLRGAVTRSTVVNPDDVFKSFKDIGVQNFTEMGGKMMGLSVQGNGFSIGGNLNINPTGPNTNIADDISIFKGKHQIMVGVSYLHTIFNQIANYGARGQVQFNGSVTGLSMADFLKGTASSWNQANLYTQYTRQNYIGAYIQDAWKVMPRFTVNLGVRWEPSIAPYDAQDRFLLFDRTLFAQDVRSVRFPTGPAGLIFNGDPQWNIGNAPANSQWARFYPRAGFSWDVFGDGKTAVRGAYGMFSIVRALGTYNTITNAPPWGNNIALTNVDIGNPWATYPGGNPFPYVIDDNTPFPRFGTYSTRQQNAPATYQHQWNLDIQRQFGADWLVTMSYLGNSTIHLPIAIQLNPASFLGVGPCSIAGTNYSVCSTTGNTNNRRILYLANPSQGQYYSGVVASENRGTASYHGLLVKVQKRLSQGVSILANHTWSHCISYPFDFNQGSGINEDQIRAFRSNCPTGDIRHIFNLSAVLQSPRFGGKGIVRKLAGNWQLSPILTVRTGAWFSVTTGIDNALTGQPNQVPLLVGNPYPENQSINNWISASAFRSPATGTLGNLGLMSLRGPGYLGWDMALSRTFGFNEGRQSFQVRGEVFNLLNRANFQNPVATLNSGTFGRVLNAEDPRILQFAAKFVF